MSTLEPLRRRFEDWLFDDALPLWWDVGADREAGGFHEALTLSGGPVASERRARVQARQTYVYAVAGALGWRGPWRQAVAHGLGYLEQAYTRPDGLLRASVRADGSPGDETAVLYNQAFGLFALAEAHRAQPDPALKARAHALAEATAAHFAHPAGGFWEAAAQRYQSNPHMHLLEAALAWADQDEHPRWAALADRVVELALSRFIHSEHGGLHEFFDANWGPAPGDEGRIVEPGHQFEWAWLLERWGRLRGREDARLAARRLFALGAGPGVDPVRGVAVNALLDDLTSHDPSARLWPQTERIKAAVILADGAEPAERERLRGEAAAGIAALFRYFDTPTAGLWRDKLRPDGTFVEEPAPASSFYHIICAAAELRRWAPAITA